MLRPCHSPCESACPLPSVLCIMIAGPCAGKTTVLSTIISNFTARGIRTFAVPEAATLLIEGGWSFDNMTPEKVVAFQSALLRCQLGLEKIFMDLAAIDEVVMACSVVWMK